MSTAPLARDADLRRLLEDGYDVTLVGGHLLVRHIPYVTADKAVAYGALAYPVAVSGDQIVSETDHRIWFIGTEPCNEHGRPLSCTNPDARGITPDVNASFMLSSKPSSGSYPDQYTKVIAYARILSHPAMAIDADATATPGAAFQEVEDDLPFRYRDTATTRAGLTVLSRGFREQRVAILGLGGTGGYVLDQVAKTPVSRIMLVDGDVFDNHNAFRAPSAPSLERLRDRPRKVDYFADLYGNMHTGISTECVYVDETNLSLLDDATFVFQCVDDAEVKHIVADHLLERHIAFVDVGMGIEEIDGRLSGLLRVLFAGTDADRCQVKARIPVPAEERDDYGRNIQVADLNALNALLAVGRWKRHLGLYADVADEGFATYSLFTNEISNEGWSIAENCPAEQSAAS